MDTIIFIVKIIVILQLSLIGVLLLSFFTSNIILYYHRKKTARRITLFTELMSNALKNKRYFDASELSKIYINRLEFISFLTVHTEQFTSYEYFPKLIKQLSQQLLIPLGRELTYSKHWFKRYTATLAYSYGFEAADEEKLLYLVKDRSLLIALNAATTLMDAPHYETVSSIIDIFSKGRRLQQSVYSELLLKAKDDISSFVIKKVTLETDIYTKVFCYRLLARLPKQLVISDAAKRDLLSTSKDLKIAVLYAMNHTKDEHREAIILSVATTPDLPWELKAAVAKILGNYSSKESIEVLKKLLYDTQWWVRLNAAQSLAQLGENGIAMLQAESANMDN